MPHGLDQSGSDASSVRESRAAIKRRMLRPRGAVHLDETLDLGNESRGVIGFAMQPSKPCARMPSRSLADASAVTAMTTTCLSSGILRIRVKASKPFKVGIRRSMRMTSGRSRSASATPASPSLAVSTLNPPALSRYSMSARFAGLSSTMSTRRPVMTTPRSECSISSDGTSATASSRPFSSARSSPSLSAPLSSRPSWRAASPPPCEPASRLSSRPSLPPFSPSFSPVRSSPWPSVRLSRPLSFSRARLSSRPPEPRGRRRRTVRGLQRVHGKHPALEIETLRDPVATGTSIGPFTT